MPLAAAVLRRVHAQDGGHVGRGQLRAERPVAKETTEQLSRNEDPGRKRTVTVQLVQRVRFEKSGFPQNPDGRGRRGEVARAHAARAAHVEHAEQLDEVEAPPVGESQRSQR